jgi:hypothetical protein
MERKEIAALLAGCEPDQMMAYADLGDQVVVIDSNGKKFRYSNAVLEQAEAELKPAPKARRKPAAKKTAPKKPVKK